MPIPKPLQKAKLILANLYAKKYGIVILCEFEGTDSNNVIDLLIQRIQEHGQAPVGIVVPARSPSNWPKAKNFSGHVLPIVIQKTDSGFDLVNFDSLAENSFFYDELCAKFKERMALLGASSFRHILVKSQRQADQQSCHTDAMQILKDTLRLLKLKDNSNCIDTLMQLEPNNGMGASAHARFYLPSCLQKTTQRSAALRASSFDGTQSLQPERKAIFSSRKSLTIGQHRYKYTGAFESKEANHFLIIKAFYNAEKILKQLEAKPI